MSFPAAALRASRLAGAVTAFAAASFVSLATPASAQTAPAAPAAPAAGGGAATGMGPAGGLNLDLGTLLKAKAGAWADYTITSKGPEKPLATRYALVERTPAKLAIEVDSTTDKGEMVIHLDFAAQGADAWKLTASKIRMGDRRVDVPAANIAAMPPLKTTDSPGDLVGTEELATPAGAFTCKHYKKSLLEGGKGPWIDLWISDKVSPTGLVKTSADAMGVTMTLVASGTGAQSKLQ